MVIQPGTVINQRYTIIEKIGIGGMAIVYRAKDEKLERYVTFKVLKEEYTSDEQFVRRFDVEARAAARLTHPNIVNVYDVGCQDLIYYIVMEYIDGVTLKELINKKAPFDNKEILGISIQIASALEHAHKNNIVHRDIKPQNILVTQNGTVKVTDFGIARAASSATLTTDSVGSVHYFSPEQARGGFVDAKSDLYSLGIVMYEMATGNLPFDGDSAVSLAYKHINEQLPNMEDFNHDLSASLKNIILKAAEKNTFNRYKDAESLNSDLKRALTNAAGDFVKKSTDFIDSPTVKITEEEINTIRGKGMTHDEYSVLLEEPDDVNKKKMRKKKEKNVIIAAIVTAFAIIALITSVGVYYISNTVNPKIPVPNLKGHTFEDALKTAEDLEIYLDKTEAHDDVVPEGEIISQNLGADEIIYKGETLTVVVSLGTDKIEIPDVINKEITDAYSYFEDLDVDVKPEYAYSDTITKNVVISQDPLPKEMVVKGSAVTLTISMGKEVTTVIVPAVEGWTEAEAIKALKAAELTVGNITYSESSKVEKDHVITQGIKAGTKAEAGDIVKLVVSSGKKVETVKATAAPVKKTKTLKVDPVLPDGKDTFNVQIIRINASHVAEEVYNKELTKKDFPLTLPVTGDGTVEFQMLVDGAMYGSMSMDFSAGE